MRIRFDQLSRAFSNRCVFDQNPRRIISVNRRPKRNEMYAFSNENALVRTGPGSKTVISGTFPLWNALQFDLAIKIQQRAKKVVSDSPGLVDFAVGLVNSVFNLPGGQVMFFEEFE